MRVHEFIESADCAVLVTAQRRIVATNPALLSLLGYREGEEILGRPCFQVLRGRDAFGNPHCSTTCMTSTAADEHESICYFRIELRRAAGDYAPVGMTTLLLRTDEWPGPATFHFIRSLPAEVDAINGPGLHDTDDPEGAADGQGPLRPIDRQILEILTHSQDLQSIAEGMRISLCSVRRSLSRIFGSLDEPTQREAAQFAHREGFL